MRSRTSTDLVLVNPNSRRRIYQSLGRTLTAVEPPVWAGLMATFVRKHGFSTQIIDAEAEELAPEEIANRVEELNPKLVAVVVYGHQPSASTQNMTGASAACSAIKEANPTRQILMVGGHVAALSRSTLIEENTDFVCSGEGLFTLTTLVAALKGGRRDDVRKVPDLWFFNDHAQPEFSGKASPLLKNLNQEMSGVAWDLLPMDRYRAHNWHCFGDLQRQPYAALYTTLGCPYHCSFCCIQAPFKSGEKAAGLKESSSSYRYWTPESVIAQIDVLVNQYAVRNIKIADEMFVLHPKHVLGICDLIIERGYDLNIWAYARVDTVRDEMLEKLKRAGFNWLAFGIEAANERVRDQVQKGFDQEDIYRTIGKVRDAGISVIGNYIFGLPEDNFDTMQETLDLALDLNCEFGNFYCAMAYPGSQLYTHALKEGLPLPETWSGYSQHAVDTLPLPTKYLPASEVIRFRDNAFHTYFSNPRYLDMVAKKFGADTLDHVREMTSFRLERNFVQPSSLVPA
jgi:radical SAM superfamily enzyme YgiQ (UPF0313 family)